MRFNSRSGNPQNSSLNVLETLRSAFFDLCSFLMRFHTPVPVQLGLEGVSQFRLTSPALGAPLWYCADLGFFAS